MINIRSSQYFALLALVAIYVTVLGTLPLSAQEQILIFGEEPVGATNSQSGTEGSTSPFVNDLIPAFSNEGVAFNFLPARDKPATVVFPVESSLAFEPPKDAPSFSNFSSASGPYNVTPGTFVNKKEVEFSDINSGTCWGISFFSGLWYKELIRPVQYATFEGEPFQANRVSSTFANGSGDSVPGIEAIVDYSQDLNDKERLPFTPEDMSSNIDAYRMAQFSGGPYQLFVKKAMIGHHNDQHSAQTQGVDPESLEDFSSSYQLVEQRIAEDGVAVICWSKYTSNWLPEGIEGEKEWDSGHAVLAYSISEVTAEANNPDDGVKSSYEAMRVDFYDPNFTSRGGSAADSHDGYNCYFFYFPETGQTTFPQSYASYYALQQGSSTIDGNLTTLQMDDVLSTANLSELQKALDHQSSDFNGQEIPHFNHEAYDKIEKANDDRIKSLNAEIKVIQEKSLESFNNLIQMDAQEELLYHEYCDALEAKMKAAGRKSNGQKPHYSNPGVTGETQEYSSMDELKAAFDSRRVATGRERYEALCYNYRLAMQESPTPELAAISENRTNCMAGLKRMNSEVLAINAKINEKQYIDVDQLQISKKDQFLDWLGSSF